MSTEVAKIVVDGSKVTGVQIERDGTTIEIASSIVVSDVGPAATVGLIGADDVPEDYRELVRKGDRPTAMISVNFASRERLIEAPGMLSFAKSRRLAYIAQLHRRLPRDGARGLAPLRGNLGSEAIRR